MSRGRHEVRTTQRHAHVVGVTLAFAFVIGYAAAVQAQTPRAVAVTPAGDNHGYVITTDSLVVDPALTIENVGSSTLRGVRVVANGRDWSSIDGMMAAILRDGMSDEQRARAIWQFARTHAYAWHPYSEFASDASDPVRFFNSYGYGLCSDFSEAMAALYRRAGFPVRIWAIGFPSGHIVPEVFFDGGWHVMDANRNILFLERDNRTIASVDTLVADGWLIDRAGPGVADLRSLYTTTPPGASVDITSVSSGALSLDLRPNERIEFLAAPRGRYRQDTTIPTPEPLLYGNAVLTTRPDAASDHPDDVFDGSHGLANAQAGSATWWTRVAEHASPRYVVSTPHPLLDATLHVTARLSSMADRLSVYAARGTAGLMLTEGDLASGAAFLDAAVVSHEGLATVGDDGLFPVLHAGPTGSGALVLQVQRSSTSDPIVVKGTLFRLTAVDGLGIDVSTDGLSWAQVWTAASDQAGYVAASADVTALVAGAQTVFVRYRFDARSSSGWAAGAGEIAIDGVVPAATTLVGTMIATEAATQEFDLTSIVAPARGAASTGYVLRFELEGAAGLERFETLNTMQVAPRLVPAPSRGTTSFVVSAAAGDIRNLRVHHTWLEMPDAAPPPPVSPLRPGRGESLALSGPLTFSWVPSSRFPLQDLRQYELQICADAACDSPLSSVTEIWSAPWLPGPDGLDGTRDDDLGVSTSPTVTLAASEWLEPGRTYHWRVRALSMAGEWSPYSDVWSFIATAGDGAAPTLSIDGPSGDRIVTTPFVSLSGTVSSTTGPVAVRWTTDRGVTGEVVTADVWRLPSLPVVGGANEVTLVVVDGAGRSTTSQVRFDVPHFAYYLAEGSTRADFATDIAIANPTDQDAPVEVHFLPDDGQAVVSTQWVRRLGRVTLDAAAVVGVGRSFAIEVRSLNAVPLAIERTMRWGPGLASGHSGAAVTAPSTTWYFAEGSQGHFDTFVLLANPNDADALANVAFLTESGHVVTHVLTVRARARATVWTRQIPQLANRSFSIAVNGSAPLVAERAVYFGQPAWTGGHVSAGAPQLAGRWFCPEGATGPYLDTYVLVGNPSSSQAAPVTVEYLTGAGAVVTETFTVAPHSRLTIDVESRAPALANAAVSTVVSSTSPVVVERATYWGGAFTQWLDGHSSMGTVSSGSAWAVADVRVGGAEAFETWLLLTNETTADIQVDLTLLPEDGDATTTRVVVPARSRYNYYVNAELPALDGQLVGVRLASVNGAPFAVERSQYWSVNGVAWSGGTSSRATLLK